MMRMGFMFSDRWALPSGHNNHLPTDVTKVGWVGEEEGTLPANNISLANWPIYL